MKIALVSSYVPFVNGGLRNIVNWLNDKLTEHGHAAEVVYLPFVDRPDTYLKQAMAYRLLRLQDTADRVIAFRPPSYVIDHPQKYVWFIHHTRVFYDLWNTEYAPVADDLAGRGLRDTIHRMDTRALSEAKKLYTNSAVVSSRLRQFNGLDSEVLYPPLLEIQRFVNKSQSDQLVYASRVEPHKRQHLLIEALAFTKSPVTVRLIGVCSSAGYLEQIKSLIKKHRLANRVSWDNKWTDEQTKSEAFATCLANVYIPVDEDSYGYSTLEAAHSSKPTVTTRDAGGVLEFVHDGINGVVAEPSPQSIAEKLDALYANKATTKKYGEASLATIQDLKISWDRVVDAFTS